MFHHGGGGTKVPVPKISLIVAVGLIIPVATYTAFQLAQSSENERLLRSIYRRQLDSILFSVNQYCWDTFNTWATELAALARSLEQADRVWPGVRTVRRFLHGKPPLAAAFVQNTKDVFMLAAAGQFASIQRPPLRRFVVATLSERKSAWNRAVRQARAGYVRPLVERLDVDHTVLLFPVLDADTRASVVATCGFVIDDQRFVDDVVARKLNAMNTGEFIFAVSDRSRDHLLYASEDFEGNRFETSESLWILPDLRLQIRLRGTTLEQLSRARTRRNLLLLGAVNAILVLALIFLLRTVAHEMTLARMKTSFVANVSHELRTPLSLIRMYAETLELGRVPDEAKRRRYYRSIVSESSRLTQLINNILDFSRIESRQKRYKFAEVDLGEVVERVVNSYRFHLDQNGFKVDVRVRRPLPPVVADPEAVEQALVNLLDNAVKFSSDRREISVEVKAERERVNVSVTDRGIGIPESEHEKIFEEFYRVGDDLVHNTRGSGLGLALVKHIMKVHRGSVKVRSRVGEGSTFTLEFPVA